MAKNQVLRGNDRLTEYPNRWKMNPTGEENVYDIEQVTGEVINEGTKFNKSFIDKLDNILSYIEPELTQEIVGKITKTRDIFIQEGTTYNVSAKKSNTVYHGVLENKNDALINFSYGFSSIYNRDVSSSTLTTCNVGVLQTLFNRTDYDSNFVINLGSEDEINVDFGKVRKIKLNYRLSSTSNVSILYGIENTDKNLILGSPNTDLSTDYLEMRYLRLYCSGTTSIRYFYFTETYEEDCYHNSYLLDNNGDTFIDNQKISIQTPELKINKGYYKDKSELLISESYYSGYIPSCLLNNGNIMVVFSTSSNGCYMILDQDGNIIKEETTFTNHIIELVSTCLLQNGNVLISFLDYYGSDNRRDDCYIILDEDGNIIKEKTVIEELVAGLNGRSINSFNNGNIIIATAVRDMSTSVDNYYGAFYILDQEGNIVKEKTTFTNVLNYNVNSNLLQNGNTLISFYENSKVYYIIVSQDGTIVKEKRIAYLSTAVSSYKSCVSKNGDVLFFVAGRVSNKSTNIIRVINYDIDNDIIKKSINITETIDSYSLYNILTLENNDIVLIFSPLYSNGEYHVYYMVIDENFIIKETSQLITMTKHLSGSSMSINNKFYITYLDSYKKLRLNIYDFDTTISTKVDNIISNSLNTIPIDTLLYPGSKYELIYDGERFIDNKILYDITLSEAVNQIDLHGISDKLRDGKIYALIIIGSVSSNSSIQFGNNNFGYLRNTKYPNLSVFSVYKDNNETTIFGFYTSSSINAYNGLSHLKTSSNNYEYIKNTSTNAIFNTHTRFIIKEV